MVLPRCLTWRSVLDRFFDVKVHDQRHCLQPSLLSPSAPLSPTEFCRPAHLAFPTLHVVNGACAGAWQTCPSALTAPRWPLPGGRVLPETAASLRAGGSERLVSPSLPGAQQTVGTGSPKENGNLPEEQRHLALSFVPHNNRANILHFPEAFCYPAPCQSMLLFVSNNSEKAPTPATLERGLGQLTD